MKICCWCIRENAPLVPNYLSDRKQRVILPGAASDWTDIKAGVPQVEVKVLY